MRLALVGLAVSVLATAGCGGGGTAGVGGAGGGGGGGGGTGATLRKTVVFPHALEVSGRMHAMSTGDLDGDGCLDMLVFNEATSSLDLLLSTKIRESPTLPSLGKTPLARGRAAVTQPVTHVFVWSSLADVCVGDVDGDGTLDVCLAGGSSRQVAVLHGDPTEGGRLGPPVVIDVPIVPSRVALGDLDGDEDCDLICLDEETGQLHTLLRTPGVSPPFVVGNDPPAIGSCHGLVVCDLDRDGSMDCVTNRYGADRVLVWAVSAATGVISPRDVASGLPTGKAMGVGDLDGDGWPDIVLVSEDGRSLVSLRQSSSSPGFFDVFVSELSIAVDEEGVDVGQISIDEPGVHVHLRESPTRRSYHLRESPTRRSLGQTARLGMTQPGVGLCDFDRDGHLDVLLTLPPGDPDFDLLMVYGIRESPCTFGSMQRASEPASGLPTGQRQRPTTREQGTGQATGKRQHGLIADLDLDGHVDVVVGDPDFDLLHVVYTGSDGAVAPIDLQERLRESPTKHSTGMVTVDLDRDGRLDVVTATSSGLDVSFQDATGRFRQPTTLGGAQSFRCVATGDLNDDGLPDLLAATDVAMVAIFRDPAGIRSFQPPAPVQVPPGAPFRSLTLADVDLDGHVDCVAIRESPSKASLGRGMGNGFFDVFTEIDVGVSSPRSVAVGDLNGDGRPDLAVCGEGPDGSSIVLQDPVLRSFRTYALYSTMKGARVALGDVNGDGRLDVVTTGALGCLVSLQDPTRRGTFSVCYSLSSVECGGLSLDDFDRNGALDVCCVEVKTGTLLVSTGDPDFDLLRIVSLNGLPPGVPYESMLLSSGDLDGDGRPDVLTFCPTAPGAFDSRLMAFGQAP